MPPLAQQGVDKNRNLFTDHLRATLPAHHPIRPAPMETAPHNWYQDELIRLNVQGFSPPDCAKRLAGTYLDGKPRQQGKRSITQRERDRQFWALDFWRACPQECWTSEAFELALTRYLAQETVAAPDLVLLISKAAPETLVRCVRHSGLVSNPGSPRRPELEAAGTHSPKIHELCKVLTIFDDALQVRQSLLHRLRSEFETASAFDVLLLASLYAFKHLMPQGLDGTDGAVETPDVAVWDSVNALLVWKLRTQAEASLRLDDHQIGTSIARVLRPILFGDTGERAALELFSKFEALMAAQVELEEYLSRSADAFSYNDSIEFVRRSDRLDIVEVDPDLRRQWEAGGQKQARLYGYWFQRALDEFAQSDMALRQIGRAENHNANQMAMISALRAQLQLGEIYGVANQVSTSTGEKIDVFQALLSLDLMSAFFQRDFLVRYKTLLEQRGDWRLALRNLALEGLSNGLQNRFPLTWSDRDAKVANITGWTVNEAQPKGSPRMANAILDFWSYDMQTMAAQLRSSAPMVEPRLHERPVLKFGKTLVQLPWIVGLQNRSTSAINNLRRLGSRRAESATETQRIEHQLGELLKTRGFQVVQNWEPAAPWRDAGEVDVIAARDGHLFVLEVKSTYMRRSMRDAWLHATTTLRKAGQQVEKKLQAVRAAIEAGAFENTLQMTRLAPPSQTHGWIVDTSIECDHEHFNGFLKISVEEMIIALRDDAHLLCKPAELHQQLQQASSSKEPPVSLYPDGFGAERFVEVIQGGCVWGSVPQPLP